MDIRYSFFESYNSVNLLKLQENYVILWINNERMIQKEARM